MSISPVSSVSSVLSSVAGLFSNKQKQGSQDTESAVQVNAAAAASSTTPVQQGIQLTGSNASASSTALRTKKV